MIVLRVRGKSNSLPISITSIGSFPPLPTLFFRAAVEAVEENSRRAVGRTVGRRFCIAVGVVLRELSLLRI